MSIINAKIKNVLLYDTLLFLVGIAGIYQLVQRAGFSTTHDLDIKVGASRQLIIEKVINSDLNAFFMAGDTLKDINTIQVSSIDELEVVTDSKKIGDTVIISFSRSENPVSLSIPLQSFYSLSYILIAFIVGIIFFFHGLFVVIKRPEDQAARIYHWVSIGAAMIIMTTWGRYTIEPMGLGYIIRLFFCAAYAFTPVLFFHFSFLFPRQKLANWKYAIIAGYILASILFIWTSVIFLLSVLPTVSIKIVRIFLIGFDSTRWFFIIFLISGILNFIHSFSIASETAEKKKILWLLLGMIGPLGFVILWQIPQALNYSAFLPEELIILFASIMPLTFTISIIRYHIMDIYLIVNRSTVYSIVVVFLLTLYALIIAIAMKVIDTFTTESSIITSAVAAILLALIFDPVRKQVQKFVDKKFFRVKYDYRLAQRKFLDEMNMGVDPKILALFTVDKLDELLKPHCMNLLMIEEESGHLIPYAKKSCPNKSEPFIDELSKIISNSPSSLFSLPDHIEPGIPYQEIHVKGEHQISIVMPVRQQNGTLLGLLCLGKKRSENVYSLEDVDLLKTVITQLGLATERLRLQSKLLLKQEEAKRLDELNKLQSFFISSVSHDLQTPLTAINMYLDLLEEKKNLTNTKKLQYFDTIRGESDRLSKLINNVLDISKIERGVKQYNLSDLNLNDLITRVYSSMKYQLEQHKFKVAVEIPDKVVYIQGDEDSLDRALTNLISNSIKYSSKERFLSIKLNLSDNHAAIEIADRGVGIGTDDQKKIFNIFYRSEEKHIQSISGAGLGLAIVNHVIKAHNGHVDLTSNPGQGSSFTLRIPIVIKN
jgi:signal transduction histidine kinase